MWIQDIFQREVGWNCSTEWQEESKEKRDFDLEIGWVADGAIYQEKKI